MKYSIEQAKKALRIKGKPKITVKNILNYVASDDLNMYISTTRWRLKDFTPSIMKSQITWKDEVSIFLNRKNIQGTLFDVKITKFGV